MPTVQGIDLFSHNNFTIPGGGPYFDVITVGGAPTFDTSFARPGDPGSMVVDSDAVQYAHSGSPTRGWRGFAWRLNSADEPGGNAIMAQMATVGFASLAKLYWIPSSNTLQHTVDDVGFSGPVVTMDAWHWIEQIFDVSGTTYSIYTRIDGTDLTPQTRSGMSASSVAVSELGRLTNFNRFSRSMWGTATSTSDWLGEQYGRLTIPKISYPTVASGW